MLSQDDTDDVHRICSQTKQVHMHSPSLLLAATWDGSVGRAAIWCSCMASIAHISIILVTRTELAKYAKPNTPMLIISTPLHACTCTRTHARTHAHTHTHTHQYSVLWLISNTTGCCDRSKCRWACPSSSVPHPTWLQWRQAYSRRDQQVHRLVVVHCACTYVLAFTTFRMATQPSIQEVSK